jgi:hypothetical protein
LSFAWINVPCISELYPKGYAHFKPTQMLIKSISYGLAGNLKTDAQKPGKGKIAPELAHSLSKFLDYFRM